MDDVKGELLREMCMNFMSAVANARVVTASVESYNIQSADQVSCRKGTGWSVIVQHLLVSSVRPW